MKRLDGSRVSPGVALLLAAAVSSSAALAGCDRESKQRAPAAPGAAAAAAALPPVAKSRAKPVFTKRPSSAPLEQFVQQQVEEGEADGRRVVVYVGATWCEPCKHFHRAVESGELDDALAGTRFVEFDADHDRQELRSAGYASKYIPLLAVPDPDGRSSGRMIEGSIKGPDSVRVNLVPRLTALLEGRSVN